MSRHTAPSFTYESRIRRHTKSKIKAERGGKFLAICWMISVGSWWDVVFSVVFLSREVNAWKGEDAW
jgi:hypothetical protein